jgi:hypothetical protein
MLVVSSPWGAPGSLFHFQAAPQPNFQQSYAFTWPCGHEDLLDSRTQFRCVGASAIGEAFSALWHDTHAAECIRH